MEQLFTELSEPLFFDTDGKPLLSVKPLSYNTEKSTSDAKKNVVIELTLTCYENKLREKGEISKHFFFEDDNGQMKSEKIPIGKKTLEYSISVTHELNSDKLISAKFIINTKQIMVGNNKVNKL